MSEAIAGVGLALHTGGGLPDRIARKIVVLSSMC